MAQKAQKKRPDREGAKTPAVDLGVFGRNGREWSITSIDIVALVLSLLWLGGVGLFLLLHNPMTENGQGMDALALVNTLMAVILPVAVIWVAAASIRSARVMREEAARLQAAIDAMRHTYLDHIQKQNAGLAVKPSVEAKLQRIEAAQKQAESAIATFTRHREGEGGDPDPGKPALNSARNKSETAQPSLALEAADAPPAPPLTVEEFIRALNFPEDMDDKPGFAALRRALQDPVAGKLVRAAQDILTLLSQDGIYMDDLVPRKAPPSVWRSFAAGKRGSAISALGGVHDRASLALASGRMRKDPVFRDTAHHFLRVFDQIFSDFAPNASDAEIAALSDTRTARAFMLLGRVTGTFS